MLPRGGKIMFYDEKNYKFAIQIQPRIADGGTVMNYANPSSKSENFLESIKYIIENTTLYQNSSYLRKISADGAKTIVQKAKLFGLKMTHEFKSGTGEDWIKIFSDQAEGFLCQGQTCYRGIPAVTIRRKPR